MKVTIITIVNGAFETVTKGLLKRLEDLKVGGRVETIQTTTLLKTARILETWEDLLSLKSNEKPSAKTDVKNSQGVNNNPHSNKIICRPLHFRLSIFYSLDQQKSIYLSNYLSVSFYLSIYLSIYLSVCFYLSIDLSISQFLSIYISIDLSISQFLSIYLSISILSTLIYLSIYLSLYLSIYLSIYQSVSIYLSISQFLLSIYLSIYLSLSKIIWILMYKFFRWKPFPHIICLSYKFSCDTIKFSFWNEYGNCWYNRHRNKRWTLIFLKLHKYSIRKSFKLPFVINVRSIIVRIMLFVNQTKKNNI